MLAVERHVDHEGGAVELLRRAEERASERVGDHDVVADFDGIHGTILAGVRNR
jgi:hypothetical protein